MSRAKSYGTERISAVASIRKELDDRVGSRAEILGSMLGIKIRSGKPTRQLGITYFVREKIPKSELSPRKRVPMTLKMGNQIVRTDIVEWPRMIEQYAATPTIISDGKTQGTLSCFASSDAGVFGISCAHCLVGADGRPATPTEVAYFADSQQRWVGAGESVYLVYSAGTGLADNYGYLDCGLFSLHDESLEARANSGQVVSVVSDTRSLLGSILVAASALNAPGSTNHWRKAVVVGVEADAMGERCDLVLAVEAPGTFRGDSGMLWLTQDGIAAAIHARGEERPGLHGSRLTTAMSAARVVNHLAVQMRI
ncbi:MAG: hypothetical protein M3Q94_10955 [Pseudomonadota bacterium]|nr:hypothetical protein [Pseudomonadota bacterium]